MELDRERFPALSRRRFILMGSMAAGLLGAGCGGGGGDNNNGGNSLSDEPSDLLPTGPLLPTIATAGTRLVPEDGSVIVTPQDNGSVVLTGAGVAALNLAPGVLLASLLDDGLVCRVASVASDGGTGVVIGTAPATLEEAFDSLEIRSLGDLDDTRSRADATATGTVPLNINVPIPDVPLYESGGKSAKATGAVKIGGQVAVLLRIQKDQTLSARSLQTLGMITKYNYSGTFTIRGDVTGSTSSSKESTISLRSLGQLADIARKTPAVVKPVLQLKGKFTGNFAAGVAFTATVGGHGTAGFVWKRENVGNGAGGFQFHGGLPSFDTPKFTSDSNINPLRSVSFTASFNPILKLYIAGIAGPYLSTQVPSLKADFTRRTDIVPVYHPSGMDVYVKALLSGEVGIDDAFNILALPSQKLFERELINFTRNYDDSGKTLLKIK